MPELPEQFNKPEQLPYEPTSKELGAWLAYLMAAIIHMDELDQTLTDEQREAGQKLKNDLSNLHQRTKSILMHTVQTHETLDLVRVQRQSVRQAFDAGWWGFHRDLLARLTPEQRAELEPILNSFAGSDIPF